MFCDKKVKKYFLHLFILSWFFLAAGCHKAVFHSNRSGNTEIYTVYDGGGGLTNVSNNVHDDFGPVYTPDGKKLIFSSDRTGDEEIFIMNENGSNQTNLTNNPGKKDSFPVVSPDGTHIAYWKERALGGGNQLFIMKIDGTGKTALSNSNSPLYPEPHVFSPSGKMLAYADSSLSQSTNFYPKLHVVDADGTNDHPLTNDHSDEVRPIFTCDNQKIVFVSMRDGNSEIYSAGVDGSGKTNLTNNPAMDSLSELSPDCSKILFVSERTGNPDIFIANIDGSGVLQLTNNPGDDYSPFFSHDGNKIGYISRPSPNNGSYDLWVMNSDGTNKHKLSSTASNGATCCPKYQFSMDDKKILYSSILPGTNFEIFIVNTNGTNLKNLSNNSANDLSASFKP